MNRIRQTVLNKKTGYRVAAFLAALFLLLSAAVVWTAVPAKAEGETQIWTYEDLLKIAENPSGSYQLMADIDLKDKTWKPVDFTGILNGNNHAILNAKVTEVSPNRHKTYDGNMVEYDTAFSGFFASLINAQVTNLKILGIDVTVDTAEPTFAGGIAGYMENGTITGCTVEGKVFLSTTGKSFGVGGIAGFGKGTIENTTADMTLICVDKDRENKDEQFMGGAYADGYIDLKNNTIRIDGYDSDHGYVHNGGLVGMYILYPQDDGYIGYITGNTVQGRIRFFEDNEDRRAYCEGFIGEIMNWTFENDGNDTDANFVRDEVYDYDTDLMPHTCANPQYDTKVVPSTETTNGYTEYTCKDCGYTFKADYQPVVGNYVPEPETESQAAPEPAQKQGGVSPVVIIVIVIVVLAIVVLIILLIMRSRKQKRLEEQRREAARRKAAARRRAQQQAQYGQQQRTARPSGQGQQRSNVQRSGQPQRRRPRPDEDEYQNPNGRRPRS